MSRYWQSRICSFLLCAFSGILPACSQVAINEDSVKVTSVIVSRDSPLELAVAPSDAGIINWWFSSDQDIVASLQSSDGWRVDVDHFFAGTERVNWVATDTARFSIRVVPFGTEPVEVQIQEQSAIATAADSIALARTALERAGQLRSAGNARLGLPLFEQVLALREGVYGPDHIDVGQALNHLALALDDAGFHIEAIPLMKRALLIMEAELGPTHQDVATVLSNLGQSLTTVGEYDEARASFERALEIRENGLPEEHEDVAVTLNNFGMLLETVGEYQKAENYYRRAIRIFRDALGADDVMVANSLSNLGLLYATVGRFDDARPLYDEALRIRQNALRPDHPDVALTLNNIGLLLQSIGQSKEAIPLFERALAIFENDYGPDHPLVATTLSNLGLTLSETGRFLETQPLYERALKIRRHAFGENHQDVAMSLNNLALLRQNMGDPEGAIQEYKQALDIFENAFGRNHHLVATALSNIAVAYQQAGKIADALPFARDALHVQEAVFDSLSTDVALSHYLLGTLYNANDALDDARKHFSAALSIWTSREGSEHPDVAKILIAYPEPVGLDWIANIERAISILERSKVYPEWLITAYLIKAGFNYGLGEVETAIAILEDAIFEIDNARQSLASSEDVRAEYLAKYSDVFDYMVAWQLEFGNVEDAIEYSERGRSRVMLDQLAAGQVDLRASIPPDILVPLEIQENVAAKRLASLQKAIAVARDRTDIADEARLGLTEMYSDSIAVAQSTYTAVYSRIKNASPLWRSYVTSGGEPVRLGDVQRNLVPANGSILYFQLGLENSNLFLIPGRGESVSVHPLLVSDEAATALNVDAGPLTTQKVGEIVARAENEDGIVANLASRGPLPARERPSEDLLLQLFGSLIPHDVWSIIRCQNEVVIVPDGSLFLLPFEALKPSMATYWLDEGPAIRYAPSLTVLYNIGRRPATRIVADALSLSDPIFSLSELAALESQPRAIEHSETDIRRTPPTRDSYERIGGNLSRLPGTLRETEAMKAAYGETVGTVMTTLSGAEATEANVRRSLAGKRFVHLATHGLVDENKGALFAALAMTPSSGSVDLANDGFLELHEIYDLPLEDLELAVLSACETNVGAAVEGEGVFALNRGFLAAGARRVIASQWAVDDASTAELIGDFFRAVIREDLSTGRIDYSSALWEAKKALRSTDEWSDPYYWAPFILTGLN